MYELCIILLSDNPLLYGIILSFLPPVLFNLQISKALSPADISETPAIEVKLATDRQPVIHSPKKEEIFTSDLNVLHTPGPPPKKRRKEIIRT